MFCLSLVLAGAIGNLIDRVLLGFVTDMFETLFMDFAVFNVADICVVCGGIAFCAYYLLCHARRKSAMTPLLLKADRDGERADQLIARLAPELTRSAAQRLLEEGAVTLNGAPIKKNYRAAAGDVLEVVLPAPEPVEAVPQDIPLDVVYEDDDVIVVNSRWAWWSTLRRAPGRDAGQRAVISLRKITLRHQRSPASRHRPSDRSGHLGLNHRGEKRLRPSGPGRPAGGPLPLPGVRGGVRGQPEGGRRHGGRPHRPQSHGQEEDGRGSEEWPAGGDPLAGDRPLPRPYPHPLPAGDRAHPPDRVHLAFVGHPLLGDTVYGAKKPVPGLAGQCLHARRLSFVHPAPGSGSPWSAPCRPGLNRY